MHGDHLAAGRDNIAVCNLASINASRHLDDDNTIGWERLERSTRLAVRQLDNSSTSRRPWSPRPTSGAVVMAGLAPWQVGRSTRRLITLVPVIALLATDIEPSGLLVGPQVLLCLGFPW